MEVSGQFHVPAALSPGIIRPSIRGFHSRSERYGEEQKLLFLPGIEPRLLGRPGCNLIAGLTVKEN
jgi:hypothetical protein